MDNRCFINPATNRIVYPYTALGRRLARQGVQPINCVRNPNTGRLLNPHSRLARNIPREEQKTEEKKQCENVQIVYPPQYCCPPQMFPGYPPMGYPMAANYPFPQQPMNGYFPNYPYAPQMFPGIDPTIPTQPPINLERKDDMEPRSSQPFEPGTVSERRRPDDGSDDRPGRDPLGKDKFQLGSSGNPGVPAVSRVLPPFEPLVQETFQPRNITSVQPEEKKEQKEEPIQKPPKPQLQVIDEPPSLELEEEPIATDINIPSESTPDGDQELINRLQNQNEDLSLEITNYKDRLAECKTSLDNIIATHDLSKEDEKKLQSTIQQLQDKVAEYEAKQIDVDIDNLTNEQLKEENEKLYAQIAGLRNTITETQANLRLTSESQSEKISELKTLVDEYKNKDAINQDKVKNTEQLKRDNQVLKSEITTLKQSISNVKQALSRELSQSGDSYAKEKADLLSKIENLESTINNKNQQLIDSDQKFNEMSEDWDELNVKFEAGRQQISKLSQEHEALKKFLDETLQNYDSSVTKQEEFKKQYDNLLEQFNVQKQKCDEMIQNLQTKNQNLNESFKNEYAKLQQINKNLQNNLTQTQSSQDRNVELLQQKNNELINNINSGTQLIERLSQENRLLMDENEQLANQISDLQRLGPPPSRRRIEPPQNPEQFKNQIQQRIDERKEQNIPIPVADPSNPNLENLAVDFVAQDIIQDNPSMDVDQAQNQASNIVNALDDQQVGVVIADGVRDQIMEEIPEEKMDVEETQNIVDDVQQDVLNDLGVQEQKQQPQFTQITSEFLRNSFLDSVIEADGFSSPNSVNNKKQFYQWLIQNRNIEPSDDNRKKVNQWWRFNIGGKPGSADAKKIIPNKKILKWIVQHNIQSGNNYSFNEYIDGLSKAGSKYWTAGPETSDQLKEIFNELNLPLIPQGSALNRMPVRIALPQPHPIPLYEPEFDF